MILSEERVTIIINKTSIAHWKALESICDVQINVDCSLYLYIFLNMHFFLPFYVSWKFIAPGISIWQIGGHLALFFFCLRDGCHRTVFFFVSQSAYAGVDLGVRVNAVSSGMCLEDLKSVLDAEHLPQTLYLPKVRPTFVVRIRIFIVEDKAIQNSINLKTTCL